MTTLPTFDLAALDGADPALIADLRGALYDHGFFYLAGHGIAEALNTAVFDAARRFFALPDADKQAVAMVRSPHFRGYTRSGQEQTRGRPDWREQLDINTEAAPWPMQPGTPAWRRLQGPNQWPEALPGLRPVLLAWQAEATRVGIALLRVIAAALGQDPGVFATIYQPQPSQLMKIIRYPGRAADADRQGVGAHRDGGFVTVLLQDRLAGLRVQAQDGGWIEVPPVPGTVVINAGELLELATNGFVRAAVHEVIAPREGAERYSVAFFLGSRPDAIVPVLDLPAELKERMRGLSVDPLNPIFREVGQNQLKSRLRSHPDVARAFYPDLVQA
jgi:isopenicillin N synthase-like dioxygenase